jgi:hypothetical protein
MGVKGSVEWEESEPLAAINTVFNKLHKNNLKT